MNLFQNLRFPIQNNPIRDLILIYYRKITEKHEKNNLTNYYDLWLNEFNIIHGDLKGQRKLALNTISENLHLDLEIKTQDELLRQIFCLQTVYAIILKILTVQVLDKIKHGNNSYSQYLTRDLCNLIESGKLFENYGIKNYSYYDYFSWYLDEWDENIQQAISLLIIKIGELELDSFNNYQSDVIKEFYENLFPSNLRHPLGEYFTPKWLIQLTIKRIRENTENELQDLHILDPTCGSGSFLIEIINEMKDTVSSDNLGRKIVNQVKGYELNPVSVISAKTNYIISLGELLQDINEQVEIPIYHCDSLYLPKLSRPENNKNKDLSYYQFEILNLEIKIPAILIENIHLFDKISHLISSTKDNDEIVNFLNSLLVYNTISKLELLETRKFVEFITQIQNPKLKHYIIFSIKSRLQPLKEKFDVIVGNPPWVGWEYIPRNYREITKNLWVDYNLFNSKGIDAANLKEDISTLMTFRFIDLYLKKGGILGFVIRSSLFKSPKTGKEFRKFGFKTTKLNVLEVDDFSSFKAFNEATSLAAVMIIKKAKKIEYPVKYNIWNKNKDKRIGDANNLESLKEVISSKLHFAQPIGTEKTSRWLISSKNLFEALDKLKGTSKYRARIGVFTGGANSVYYIQIIEKISSEQVKIRNYTKGAKRKAEIVEKIIEKSMIKPILKGRDLEQWNFNHRLYLIFPHSRKTLMRPISIEIFKKEYPKTLEYFYHFKDILDQRRGFSWDKEVKEDGFYSIQRIGEYTFKTFLIAWRYISKKFQCAVIRPIMIDDLDEIMTPLPNDKLSFIGTNNEEEAYYICGLLTSSPYKYIIQNTMVSTQISPSIINGLNLPKFSKKNVYHKNISQICKQAHQNLKFKDKLQTELDEIVCEFLDIKIKSLSIIKQTLN